MKKKAKYPITVSVSVLSQLLRYLAHLEVDVDEVFRGAGVDPDFLKNPDTRIPIEAYIAIEDEAVRISNDPYFGLHMGEFAEPGSWSILGYMMMNCRTLSEVAEKSARYSNIIGNLIQTKAVLGWGTVKVVLATPKHAPMLSRHCFESALSSTVRMGRNLTGKQIDPLEVGFSYPEPASIIGYERVFCSPVFFEQKQTYITYDIKVGKTPVLQPNAKLLEHFENYAQEYLADIEGIDQTTRAVTKQILGRMDNEKLCLSSIAEDMSMSVRTLQNHLKNEGVVFRDLLEDTRERLAKKYLCENYTVEDITYLLGFSEPSVFRKAFKRWSGSTPREYRQMVLARNRHGMN